MQMLASYVTRISIDCPSMRLRRYLRKMMLMITMMIAFGMYEIFKAKFYELFDSPKKLMK